MSRSSHRRFARARRAISTALGCALVLGCAPVSLLPIGFEETGIEPARIEEGRGVRFMRLDGQEVDERPVWIRGLFEIVQGNSAMITPGAHSLRVKVRRHMRSLDKERLDGIYRVGTCRIRFDAESGKHYEVYTKIFSEERTQVTQKKYTAPGTKPETQMIVGLTVHVLDVERGRDRRLDADACDLKLDCSKVNRLYAKVGKECTL